MDQGIVSEWHNEDGWGVIDSPNTPGGCWTHFSAVRVAGYRALAPNSKVLFEFEPANQDGYRFRAVAVWPPGSTPGSADPNQPSEAGTAYRSTLTVMFDEPGHSTEK